MSKYSFPASYPQDTPAPANLSIVIRDYWDGTQQRLGGANSNEAEPLCLECDLLIAIDAPAQLLGLKNAPEIYLDPFGSPTRNLDGTAWQIRSAQEMSPSEFSIWSHEVADLITQLVLEQGIVCIDLVDLALILSQGTQPLRCLICDWPNPHRLPDALQGRTFKYALWGLFAASGQLDMALFEKANALFDQIGFPDGMYVGAARIQSVDVPRLMFIGV